MIVVKAKVLSVKVRRPTKRRIIWDNYKEVGYVRKGTQVQIVVAAGARDGVKYINIREFYRTRDNTDWRAGRAGITIPIRIPINKGTEIIEPYSKFIEWLQKTAEVLETFPIYDVNGIVHNMKEEAE